MVIIIGITRFFLPPYVVFLFKLYAFAHNYVANNPCAKFVTLFTKHSLIAASSGSASAPTSPPSRSCSRQMLGHSGRGGRRRRQEEHRRVLISWRMAWGHSSPEEEEACLDGPSPMD